MYVLIHKTGLLVGLFSSKEKMKIVIEELIRSDYAKSGYHGNYNFRWVKLNIDEPWFTKDGKKAPIETNAILSFSTMHDEKFIHKVQTDWSTGKILSMDSDRTTNLDTSKFEVREL